MEFEAVIGLEVHAQLKTDTKMFCSCKTDFKDEPNTNTCPVCYGLPGALPVINKRAVEFAIKAGLAFNCKINLTSVFSRKNYFYPDLPKGYQITQYEIPICEGGEVKVDEGKSFRLERIHLEEDAAKSMHRGDRTLIDFNRSGIPLIEIVSKPDMRSGEDAYRYLVQLRAILRYLGICDGNMEEGSLRCDANISVRPKGQKELGTKTELKNLNSFRFVQKAIDYEIKRQIEVIKSGGRIVQETRLYDEKKNETRPMRSKEKAHDYRYFPEPDLKPLVITEEEIESIRKTMPELPLEKALRFVEEFGIKKEDAYFLTLEKSLADYFEKVAKESGNPKTASALIQTELLRELNAEKKPIDQCELKPETLVKLIKLIDNKTISMKIAKDIFPEIYKTNKDPEVLVKEKGLVQITDESAIEEICKKVIDANPSQVEKYRGGKQGLFGFFVGQVMKETRGKANPQIVNRILKKLLDG